MTYTHPGGGGSGHYTVLLFQSVSHVNHIHIGLRMEDVVWENVCKWLAFRCKGIGRIVKNKKGGGSSLG